MSKIELNVKERRAHERHATELDVHGTHNDGHIVGRMVARNLSLGGLYCTSSTDFPEMTRLAVRLMLPFKNGRTRPELAPVDVEAVVVRREEVTRADGRSRFDLALYFTNLEEVARSRIQRFLDERS